MELVCLSDTHGLHWQVSVPEGDVLIHAGDLTRYGHLEEVADFNTWLGKLPHRHKIVVAGNHDWCFERHPIAARALLTNAHYLLDEGVLIDNCRFYGSPWQPWFNDWAFNLKRSADLRAKWQAIPDDTDVLITHGPPYGHGDCLHTGAFVGCNDLLNRVELLKPALHIFGHIHEGHGITSNRHTQFVNASICNRKKQPINPPFSFTLTTFRPKLEQA